MSVIPSLSWVTGGTPDYITRQEAIDFTSSVVGYLSSGALSSINFNSSPNPSFSTINMNPTGSINMNASALVNATSVGVSSIGSWQSRAWVTGQNAFTATAVDNNSLEGIQAQTLVAKDVVGVVNAQGWYGNKTGLYGASNDTWNGNGVAGLTWLGSNGGNQWSLNNISTINGTPPNTGSTSFTTLTGDTLNASVAVNTPVVNNISSFNGSPVIAEFDSTYTMPAVGGLANETFVVLTTINLPFNVPTDSAVLFSVNLRIGSFAPSSPPVFYGLFGVRIGGQGAGGGAYFPCSVVTPTALQNTTISFQITGVAQTPTASTTNTLEILAYNTTGTAVTCQITSPVSPANLVYAKVLY
jgi:hypothetical protein